MPPKVKHTYPAHVNPDLLRSQAQRRRQALTEAGCSTYVMGYRNGGGAIVCLCCGLGSSNANDIRERYCGFCRQFHSEWREPSE